MPRSKIAFMIGESGEVRSMPIPHVEVSRSRTVIGRRAGTVSSNGPSTRVSTCRSTSSGSHSCTGSSSRSLHSSSKAIVAAIATGLDVDAIRKMVSRRIGAPPVVTHAPERFDVHLTAPADQGDQPGDLPDSTCRASTPRNLRRPASVKPLLSFPTRNLLLRRKFHPLRDVDPQGRRRGRRPWPVRPPSRRGSAKSWRVEPPRRCRPGRRRRAAHARPVRPGRR